MMSLVVSASDGGKRERLPVIGIRDALHTAIGVVDAYGSARDSVRARIIAQKVRLELVGDRSCEAQEKDIRLAVIEHQPHALQQSPAMRLHLVSTPVSKSGLGSHVLSQEHLCATRRSARHMDTRAEEHA